MKELSYHGNVLTRLCQAPSPSSEREPWAFHLPPLLLLHSYIASACLPRNGSSEPLGRERRSQPRLGDDRSSRYQSELRSWTGEVVSGQRACVKCDQSRLGVVCAKRRSARVQPIRGEFERRARSQGLTLYHNPMCRYQCLDQSRNDMCCNAEHRAQHKHTLRSKDGLTYGRCEIGCSLNRSKAFPVRIVVCSYVEVRKTRRGQTKMCSPGRSVVK